MKYKTETESDDKKLCREMFIRFIHVVIYQRECIVLEFNFHDYHTTRTDIVSILTPQVSRFMNNYRSSWGLI